MQRLQVDRGVFECDDELECAALVLEEEIFRVAAGDLAAQATQLRNGEQRRMADGAMLDVQAVEKGEQIVRGGGHGGKRIYQGSGATGPLPPAPVNPIVSHLAAGVFAVSCQARQVWLRMPQAASPPGRGCSSGVEHNLAKVGVVGSNPIARSKVLHYRHRVESDPSERSLLPHLTS